MQIYLYTSIIYIYIHCNIFVYSASLSNSNQNLEVGAPIPYETIGDQILSISCRKGFWGHHSASNCHKLVKPRIIQYIFMHCQQLSPLDMT